MFLNVSYMFLNTKETSRADLTSNVKFSHSLDSVCLSNFC